MKFLFFNLILFLLAFNSGAHIEIGGDENTQKKETKDSKIKEPKSRNVIESTRVFVLSNWSRTNRYLTPNGSLFGDSLGTRKDEIHLNKWSYSIGIQSPISEHFFWDGGLAYMRNGESYSYVDPASDSTYSYQTNYSYFGMPVRVNFVVGKLIRFYAGVGLVPQMFTGYRQDRYWSTNSNTTGSEKFTTKSGYNSFVLSGIGNVGAMIDFQNGWLLLVSPELKWQFNSSMQKQDAYIHKARCYGISFGLVRNL
jgi:hypothetical protein